MCNKQVKAAIIMTMIGLMCGEPASIQARNIELTLENAVELALNNSYQIKKLELMIEKNIYWLKARKAALRSHVYATLRTPDLQNISDYKWNSILQKDQIVRQNTMLWQSDISIRQPVILFGYPTNGYLSLNYKIYRYTQRDNGYSQVDYYNRLYLQFDQPFFLPNRLKNDLEQAELNLEGQKLRYLFNRLDIMEDIAEQYNIIFQMTYTNIILQHQLEYLKQIQNVAAELAKIEPSREMEKIQIDLEQVNVRESLLENKSRLRRRIANLKQRLRIDPEDSLYVLPKIDIQPINIDLEQAIEYGCRISPRLRELAINRRQSELDVERQKGNGAFHVSLKVTYGLEKENSHFTSMWNEYDNSNSATLNAYIPLWDWNQRKYRIQAEQLDIKRWDISIQQYQENTKKEIRNTFTNMLEYQARFNNVRESVTMSQKITQMSIDKFKKGEMSVQDLLQIINRHKETETKFLETFLGYKRALLNMTAVTFYNYEKNMSLIDEFQMELD